MTHIELPCDAVVEADPKRQEQVGGVNRIVGIHRPMHPQHVQGPVLRLVHHAQPHEGGHHRHARQLSKLADLLVSVQAPAPAVHHGPLGLAQEIQDGRHLSQGPGNGNGFGCEAGHKCGCHCSLSLFPVTVSVTVLCHCSLSLFSVTVLCHCFCHCSLSLFLSLFSVTVSVMSPVTVSVTVLCHCFCHCSLSLFLSLFPVTVLCHCSLSLFLSLFSVTTSVTVPVTTPVTAPVTVPATVPARVWRTVCEDAPCGKVQGPTHLRALAPPT